MLGKPIDPFKTFAGLGVPCLLLALTLLLFSTSGDAPVRAAALPTPTPATEPFLSPPFAGGYRITAYLDHLSPNYRWDDTVVVYTGEQASAIDGVWGRTPTFRGGFWQPQSERTLYYDGHGGTDYALPKGTTVLAAAPGEVVFAGSAPSGCATPLTYVCLAHEDAYRTYYLHLDAVCVRAGQQVQAGDPVGISGNSGCSTGPHLHLGVERADTLTDPYGWTALDRPDPLIETAGAAATWLWAAGAPPTTPVTHTLTGRLTSPPPDTHANGDLQITFEPDPGCPLPARVEFWAYYASALDGEAEAQLRWHRLGVDGTGADGWSLRWDTRQTPEGPAWLHAWVVDEAGQVGKGSPIHDSVTVDRHPPLGRLAGLQAGGVAGRRLWLYVTAEDPESGVRRVDLLARINRPQDGPALEPSPADWTEIGQARRLHDGEWLLEWEPAGPPLSLWDGARIDVVARLTDRAGNAALTDPVEGLTVDDRAPLGQFVQPPPGAPLTTTVELAFVPAIAGAPIDQVAFYAWYDQDWHEVGTDERGSGGWQVRWDPAGIEDQVVRVRARPSGGGTTYTGLPQLTGLVLDRTPPQVGYLRPRTLGVAHPDVAQQVWVREEGSGVARVEFYADRGQGRFRIGADKEGEDGWSILWDAAGVADGALDLIARAVDRAGNAAWSEVQREVALDRGAPTGALRVEPHPGGGATHTLILDVTDDVSGLDRAILYARPEGGAWHHLGADDDPSDGLRLEWDGGSLGVTGPVELAAWVYDRAGNHVELAYEGSVWVEAGAAPSPTAIPTRPDETPTPTTAPTREPTAAAPDAGAPGAGPTPSVETPTPVPPPEETASPTPTVEPKVVAAATVSATATAGVTATAPPTSQPAVSGPLGLRLETLIALGVAATLVGLVGLIWAIKNSRSAG